MATTSPHSNPHLVVHRCRKELEETLHTTEMLSEETKQLAHQNHDLELKLRQQEHTAEIELKRVRISEPSNPNLTLVPSPVPESCKT